MGRLIESAKQIVRSEIRRAEILGPSSELSEVIDLALRRFQITGAEGKSCYIMTQGIRIGRRIDVIRKHGREYEATFLFVDEPIGYDINVRQGIEVGMGEARLYTSDIRTNFEYTENANVNHIKKFKHIVPFPVFKRPVASNQSV